MMIIIIISIIITMMEPCPSPKGSQRQEMVAQPQIEKKSFIWGWTSQKTGRQDDMISQLFVLQGVSDFLRSHPFKWTAFLTGWSKHARCTNLWQLSRVKLSFYILNPNFWWVNPYFDAWDCGKFGSPASEKKLRQASLTSRRWCRLERCRRFRRAIGEFGTINQSTNQPMFLFFSLSLSIHIYTCTCMYIIYIYNMILYIYIYTHAHTRMLFLINYLYSQPPWGGAMVRDS